MKKYKCECCKKEFEKNVKRTYCSLECSRKDGSWAYDKISNLISKRKFAKMIEINKKQEQIELACKYLAVPYISNKE